MSVLCPALFGQDPPSMFPGRPSAADPARITTPGYFEVEVGFSSTRERSGADILEMPLLVKYSLNDQIQLRLGTGGFILPLDESGTRDFTSISLGSQIYFLKQDDISADVAVRATVDILTRSIGAVKPDVNLLLLGSRDLEDVHLDANVGITRLSGTEGSPRHELSWAVAFDGPLSDSVGWATELHGNHSSADDTLFGLLAATFAPRSTLVFDAGVELGLNTSSPRFRILGGLSFLLE